MELVKKLEPLALLLIIVAALNWAIVALFDTNVIEEAFGTGTLTDVIYVVFGLCGLALVPRLMDEIDLGHRARPHGV